MTRDMTDKTIRDLAASGLSPDQILAAIRKRGRLISLDRILEVFLTIGPKERSSAALARAKQDLAEEIAAAKAEAHSAPLFKQWG